MAFTTGLPIRVNHFIGTQIGFILQKMKQAFMVKKKLRFQQENTHLKEHAVTAILRKLKTWAVDHFEKHPDLEQEAKKAEEELKKSDK
ncbi:hypothetical protein Q8W17_04610 [Photobacterium damselae subsp. piscicida]|nr:hypothetical protein [Photobacterium damselae subsp. piscicida]